MDPDEGYMRESGGIGLTANGTAIHAGLSHHLGYNVSLFTLVGFENGPLSALVASKTGRVCPNMVQRYPVEAFEKYDSDLRRVSSFTTWW